MLVGKYALFDNSWEDYLILLIVALACLLVFRLLNTSNNPKKYQADKAWLRAGIYFCVCLIISWVFGVLKVITRTSVVSDNQLNNPVWISFALVCLFVEIIAYYVIWRKGTLTHGRPLSLGSNIVFGTLWGISEGLLFLSIWAMFELFIPNTVVVTIASFILISAFLGIWHSKYWDIQVAPEHNIPEWNIRKVLFAHIPNLLVTLTFFALYGNAALFVLYQTIALLGSTYFMRFPAYSYKHN